MAVWYRSEASNFHTRADDYEQRARLAAAHPDGDQPTGLASAMWTMLGSRAPDLRRRALESEVRALFCEDAISVAQRDLALALAAEWAGTLDDLLASADAVLQPRCPTG